jgi:Ni/Fe-hydrogenase subunit HybB-like protein
MNSVSHSAAGGAHHAPAPLGGPLVTPVTVGLAALFVAALVVILVRFFFGLGAVTNINDGYPMGVWVVYDIVIGSAFACGGYAMALLVYIFNRGEFHPLVRPALLASLFGYTLAGASVLLDLGRYWNFWHIFWPGFVNVNSVMFELAACISLYVVVMWIEFSPVFLEKLGLHDARRKLSRVMFLAIALGVLLPSMHQSSLGSMVVIFGQRIAPLWRAGWALPLLFLITAVLLGFAVVVFEATLVAVGFKRTFETSLLSRLAGFIWGLLVAYLVVRAIDLTLRGAWPYAFAANWAAVCFWAEMASFAVPVWLLFGPRDRSNPGRLFGSAVLLMLGGFLLRMNVFLVGYEPGAGYSYFPSIPEMLVTAGLIAFEILGYIVFVRRLPVLPAAHPSRTAPMQALRGNPA